jgi:hypothetical protein
MRYYLLVLFLVSCNTPHRLKNENAGAKIFRIHSTHTSFPDPARSNGHIYDSVLYDAATHYSDSSVLIIVPPGFSAGKNIDLIFWFHGWRNNIDTANQYYELSKQFFASGRNAVLVLAETAKNAPDSYGGKLEKDGEFSFLIDDVLNELKTEKVIPQTTLTGNITLAGHSGAFRVIAYILQNGKARVQEVLLFDALYSEVPKFMQWIKEDPKNRFVHWYTNKGGGTDEVTKEMIQQLQKENIAFAETEEASLTPEQIKNSRVLFVHSLREHNDIINKPDDFELLLKATR